MAEAWEQYMSKPQKTDGREELTDDDIRYDLLDRVKLLGLKTGLFVACFAFLVYLLVLVPWLAMLYFVLYILLAVCVGNVTWRFIIAVRGYLYSRKQIRLTKDKKCGHKIIYPWWSDSFVLALFHRWCYLFFSKYGKYHLPITSYKWSKNAIGHMDFVETAYDKDEFYVVLDQKDRILMAYPCKFFRYQEDEKG